MLLTFISPVRNLAEEESELQEEEGPAVLDSAGSVGLIRCSPLHHCPTPGQEDDGEGQEEEEDRADADERLQTSP